MTQRAFRASTGTLPDSGDFNQNYRYLKKLLQQLKDENRESVQKELFGEAERKPNLSKKEMKTLFRFLRSIEDHYEDCRTSPIPAELEDSIRNKDTSNRLPWEQEAIEKADSWRKSLRARKKNARKLLCEALDKIRNGEKID
jgi:hypothetical protein